MKFSQPVVRCAHSPSARKLQYPMKLRECESRRESWWDIIFLIHIFYWVSWLWSDSAFHFHRTKFIAQNFNVVLLLPCKHWLFLQEMQIFIPPVSVFSALLSFSSSWCLYFPRPFQLSLFSSEGSEIDEAFPETGMGWIQVWILCAALFLLCCVTLLISSVCSAAKLQAARFPVLNSPLSMF